MWGSLRRRASAIGTLASLTEDVFSGFSFASAALKHVGEKQESNANPSMTTSSSRITQFMSNHDLSGRSSARIRRSRYAWKSYRGRHPNIAKETTHSSFVALYEFRKITSHNDANPTANVQS
jgi:hypothetical protein